MTIKTQNAIAALQGYLSALQPGDIVTEGYLKRLRNHYLKNLKKADADANKTGK